MRTSLPGIKTGLHFLWGWQRQKNIPVTWTLERLGEALPVLYCAHGVNIMKRSLGITCLLRNLYTGQEATVRNGHGTTKWFQIVKGVRQGCILSPCLFNLHAEYITWNVGLNEEQSGIKARRNINNLRYADDTTLMAESEEELKNLLMKVKEENEKTGLQLNIQKTKIMASGPITSWQIDREMVKTVTNWFFGCQNHCRWWLQPWN